MRTKSIFLECSSQYKVFLRSYQRYVLVKDIQLVLLEDLFIECDQSWDAAIFAGH